MVIEERNLIYPANRDTKLEQQRSVYYNYYSIQRLSKLVEKMVYVEPAKTDLWQSLVTCFTLFEYTKFGKELGIAPLGSGLFAPDALGILEEQTLDNETLLKVLRNLVTFENENTINRTLNYHTYSSLAVNVFRLLVVEGVIPWDSIEFYTDDKQIVINKYANCLDSDKAKWGYAEWQICFKLSRAQMVKKNNENKAIEA